MKLNNELFSLLNPSHPTISIHILHTVLYTFPKGAVEENLFTNQEPL